MLLQDPEDPVFHDLDSFLLKMKIDLVDFSTRTKNGSTQVHIILTSQTGLTIDDCAKVHRVLLPRLEALLKSEDLYVEVSSPGLDRNIKFVRELRIFQGKKMKLYLVGSSDWEEGKVVALHEKKIEWETPKGIREIEIAQIHKAKLFDL